MRALWRLTWANPCCWVTARVIAFGSSRLPKSGGGNLVLNVISVQFSQSSYWVPIWCQCNGTSGAANPLWFCPGQALWDAKVDSMRAGKQDGAPVPYSVIAQEGEDASYSKKRRVQGLSPPQRVQSQCDEGEDEKPRKSGQRMDRRLSSQRLPMPNHTGAREPLVPLMKTQNP